MGAAVVAGTGVVVWDAWATHDRQVYPTVVHLTHHAPLAAGLLLATYVLTLAAAASGVRRLFFPPALLPAEAEALTERAKAAAMDALLAMTVFRTDISLAYVLLGSPHHGRQGLPLAAPAALGAGTLRPRLHADAHAGRQLEQQAVVENPTWAHFLRNRLHILLLLLLYIDLLFVRMALPQLVKDDTPPTPVLLFGFEVGRWTTTALTSSQYCVQAISLVVGLAKSAVRFVDARMPNGWEKRSISLLCLDALEEMLRFALCTVFFLRITQYYGWAIHLTREWLTAGRQCYTRFADVHRFCTVTRHFRDRFRAATTEEMAARGGDTTCIICREAMEETGSGTKWLQCGHVFHAACLLSWIETQPSCPTCRRSLLPDDPPPPPPETPEPVPEPVRAPMDPPGASFLSSTV